MTKQRLAEIMAEIDNGCEELYEKGVTVILGTKENKGKGANVGVLGFCEPEGAEMIALSILYNVWETDFSNIPFAMYMVSLCEAVIEADSDGTIKKI